MFTFQTMALLHMNTECVKYELGVFNAESWQTATETSILCTVVVGPSWDQSVAVNQSQHVQCVSKIEGQV
jgi:hypothetical protein